MPRFYGTAYFNWARGERICLPVPLNILAMLWWRLYTWLKVGHRPDWFTVKLMQARQDGYDEGFREALLFARQRMEAEIATAIRIHSRTHLDCESSEQEVE